MFVGIQESNLPPFLDLRCNSESGAEGLFLLIMDDLIIIENFISPNYENVLERYFVNDDWNISWDKKDDITVPEDSPYTGKNKVGYSHVLATTTQNFPNPLSNAWNFVFPMVFEGFHKAGISVDFLWQSRVFKTPPSDDDDPEYIHVDSHSYHWVCLYYPHDSDGDTVFFNQKWPEVTMDNAPTTKFTEYTRVTPKKGRAVIFDGTRFHSAYRSKKQHRVVINTNASVL